MTNSILQQLSRDDLWQYMESSLKPLLFSQLNEFFSLQDHLNSWGSPDPERVSQCARAWSLMSEIKITKTLYEALQDQINVSD